MKKTAGEVHSKGRRGTFKLNRCLTKSVADIKIMAKSKLVKVNEKIAEGVVGSYKKIEKGVVGAYKKVEDKFVDQYLTKDGESVEDAKVRLKAEQKEAGRGKCKGSKGESRAGSSPQTLIFSKETGGKHTEYYR
jgi:hypothetical protein